MRYTLTKCRRAFRDAEKKELFVVEIQFDFCCVKSNTLYQSICLTRPFCVMSTIVCICISRPPDAAASAAALRRRGAFAQCVARAARHDSGVPLRFATFPKKQL